MNRDQRRATLDADLRALGLADWTWREQCSPTSRARIARYQRQLRALEYGSAQPPTLLRRLVLAVQWRVHLRNAATLGFTIPLNAFGPGLDIAHIGTIVVNEHAKIGSDCRIHPGVTIGATNRGAPKIGDRVYLGAGAKIAGPVIIGDNAVIAPNAVVTKDVPANSIVAGVPAVVIRTDVPWEWRP